VLNRSVKRALVVFEFELSFGLLDQIEPNLFVNTLKVLQLEDIGLLVEGKLVQEHLFVLYIESA
jgi:hypothetical protein